MADGNYSSSWRRAAPGSFLGAWYWLAINIALTACARSSPRPAVQALRPEEVSSSQDSVLEVQGERFYAVPRVALGSDAPARVERTFRVRLGSFETADVERVDARKLRFTLPAGMPAGAYDLEVFPPGGDSLRLAGALRVRDDTPDAGVAGKGQVLQLEDAPSGAGHPLDKQTTRSASSELVVYAVLRDASGGFVANVPVSWRLDGDVVASSSEPSAELRLPLNRLGDFTVHASYMDLSAQAGPIHVVPGHARVLSISPNTANLLTSDPALKFSVTGVDALGNATSDLGPLSWRIELGSFGDFDATNAILTPRLLGSGRISVSSGYGAKAVSGVIAVQPGAAAELSIEPASLSLSADDAPVQLNVTARDVLGNTTTEVGTLTWSVASGAVSSLGANGQIDPLRAGSGTVRVTSSLGPRAQSGTIEVRPGRVHSMTVAPNTWSGSVGDAPVAFTVTGVDADGNSTSDLGDVSYAIGSGPIGDITPLTGMLTPRTAGDGTVVATSSYGASGQSGTIHIATYSPQVSLSALRVIDTLWPGQSAARVEVDVKNDETREVVLAGLGWSFTNVGFDVSSDYLVTADRANVDRVAPGTTRTLLFWIDVASSSNRSSLTVGASADVFLPTGYVVQRSVSSSVSQRSSTQGPKITLTLPVVPNNRVCQGGSVSFDCSVADTLFTPTYAWSFAGGTPSASAAAAPSATYSASGAFAYAVTVIDSIGYRDTALGQPVFVGSVASAAADTYPTGPIVVSAPTAGQSVSLGSFPRNNLLQLSASVPVAQCNGALVAATGHNQLTVFSDRALFDPAADSDGARPGIQLPLTALGGLDAVPLRAPLSPTEGSTTLYLEYADLAGTVTAAGNLTFRLTQDTSPPRVESSYPSSDCTSACQGRGEALLFQFSEPMSVSSLSNVKVELLASASCTAGVQSDLSGSTTRRYDAASRTLYVTPAAQSAQSYALRVSLPASITDAAAAPNGLQPLVRCVIMSGAASSAVAARPGLSSPGTSAFSPDGDGASETLTWQARAFTETIALSLALSRGRSELRALIVPVSGPGDYALTWDGTDNAGRVVDSGVYRYDLTAINRAGVASAAVSGYVDLQSAVRMLGVRRRY